MPFQEEDAPQKRLSGLGTAATRHTFIPYLLKRGYIALEKKDIICTALGADLLKIVRASAIKNLADVATTTDMEERLNENPRKYLEEIKDFVRAAVGQSLDAGVCVRMSCGKISCPVCGREVRRGKYNWYCSGGCKFTVWEEIAGAKVSEKDVENLCKGKPTGIKRCKSKAGKAFDCRFVLNQEMKVEFLFEKKR